jgi:hypothetical protein
VVSSLVQHSIYSTWFYNPEKNLLIETIVNPEQNEATEAHPWFINDLVEDVIGDDEELKSQTGSDGAFPEPSW